MGEVHLIRTDGRSLSNTTLTAISSLRWPRFELSFFVNLNPLGFHTALGDVMIVGTQLEMCTVKM